MFKFVNCNNYNLRAIGFFKAFAFYENRGLIKRKNRKDKWTYFETFHDLDYIVDNYKNKDRSGYRKLEVELNERSSELAQLIDKHTLEPKANLESTDILRYLNQSLIGWMYVVINEELAEGDGNRFNDDFTSNVQTSMKQMAIDFLYNVFYITANDESKPHIINYTLEKICEYGQIIETAE